MTGALSVFQALDAHDVAATAATETARRVTETRGVLDGLRQQLGRMVGEQDGAHDHVLAFVDGHLHRALCTLGGRDTDPVLVASRHLHPSALGPRNAADVIPLPRR